jgi:energy-converting hydrogenase Eha subunit H
MDVLTFISIIFVTLVVGFIAMIYVISKTEYGKLLNENEKLKKEIVKLKERKIKKEYKEAKNVK